MEIANDPAILAQDRTTTDRLITVFVCAQCARGGQRPSSRERQRPQAPPFGWTLRTESIMVACAGRLQPEHVLKAFERGADAVCVVACEQDNCHSLQGSRRCRRRVEYLRDLVDQIGIGGERLLLFHLPGSAREDMALGIAPLAGQQDGAASTEVALGQRLAAIREQVTARVRALPPSPVRISPTPVQPARSPGR